MHPEVIQTSQGSLYTNFRMAYFWDKAKENQVPRGNFSKTDTILFYYEELQSI